MQCYLREIPTPAGSMPTWIVRPDDDKVRPTVVLYMDVYGIRDELIDFARRFAQQGYCCLLPDLYYRSGLVRLNFAHGNDKVLPIARALMEQLADSMVVEDTGALLHWIRAEPTLDAQRIAIVGHCMSGRHVVNCAAAWPQEIAAVGSLYGTALVGNTPDSPHHKLAAARAEFYFAFGGRDTLIPEATRDAVRQALEDAGLEYTLDCFDEAEHGFAFPARKAYDAAAAEATWQRLFDLLQRRLAAPPAL
jgi:carboxymethylenebutenolidase